MELNNIEKKNNHVADIANSIFASWNLFPAATVDFIPFFDNLKSLIQDRIILSFFNINNNERKLLFHTFQDPYFENDIDTKIINFVNEYPKCGIDLSENISLYAMRFNFSNSETKLALQVVELEDTNNKQLEELIATIKQEYEQLIPVVSNFVKTANNSQQNKYRQPIANLVNGEFDLQKDFYLDEVRELIEECIVDVSDSLLLKVKLGDNEFIPNLFAVVAYPSETKRCNVFNYSAQILLTKNQKEAIAKWSQSEDYSNILETPLSNSARSISDTSFCTGFVEYSGIAGREMDSSGSVEDKARQQKEEGLYAALTNTNNIDERVVNFIPIFLNGCPWIVFYTLSKKEENSNKAWDHNYFIYRDLISKVGNSLRIKAKSRYFEIIGDIIENSYNGSIDAESYMQKANLQLQQLGCFFPFPIPVLGLKQSVPTDVFFLNKVEFTQAGKLKNEFWKPYLEYDNLNQEIILNEASEILKDFINQKETENKKRELSIASYSSAHFYGNWLGVMNRAVSNISNDIKTLPETCKSSSQYKLLDKSRTKIHDANNGMLGVTKIVDLLAKRNAINDNLSPHQYLASDDRFSTTNPINLHRVIQKIQSLLGINPINNITNKLCILKFLPGDKSPAKEFYENIILEAFLNYDKRKSGQLEITELFEDSLLTGLIFKNPYECSIDETSMSNFLEVSTTEFKGAILYYHLFLKQYELGKILYRRRCVGSNGTFELQLYFNHLTYEQ